MTYHEIFGSVIPDKEIGGLLNKVPEAESGAATAIMQTKKEIEASLMSRLQASERKVKEYEDWYRRAQDEMEAKNQQYTMAEGEVAMLNSTQCAECAGVYNIIMMADRLRYRFRHERMESCSRSMTEFFRPVAQFIKFI